MTSEATPLPRDASRGWGGLRECPDCGLFQRVPNALPTASAAECVRCGRTLRSQRPHAIGLSLSCAVLGAVLFGISLDTNVMEFRALGRFSSDTVFTGPEFLVRRGTWQLAVLVLFTLVAMPAAKLAVTLAALGFAALRRQNRAVSWLFGWLERIAPWSMVEVFLVGASIAFSRLSPIASVEVGPALVCVAGAALAMAGADVALDRETIWSRIARPAPDRRGRPRAERIGCDTCGLVALARPGDRCERCLHVLGHRTKNSIARVWACVISAAVLYIPANLLPVMTVTRFGRGGPRTIVGGVLELVDKHLWPLAVIVFLASIAVPLLKLAVLAVVLVTTQLGSSRALRARTRLYRAIRAIGRWSMIDVFMLATLVGLVRLGFIGNVLPDPGAIAFAAVVVLTMLATELLDVRLMWDAAAANREEATS